MHTTYEYCWTDATAEAAAATAAAVAALDGRSSGAMLAREPVTLRMQVAGHGSSSTMADSHMPSSFGVVLDGEPEGEFDSADEAEVVQVEVDG